MHTPRTHLLPALQSRLTEHASPELQNQMSISTEMIIRNESSPVAIFSVACFATK